MEIKNLKELSELVSMCRKLGIDDFKLGHIEFKLGALPPKQRRISRGKDPLIDESPLKNPSEEDILFWSSPGLNMDVG